MLDLAFTVPSASQSGPPPRQLRAISTFIHRLVNSGDLATALTYFVEIATRCGSAPYSSKQSKTAASILHGLATTLSARADAGQLTTLATSLSHYPEALWETTVRSILRNPAGRSVLTHALEQKAMSGNAATYAFQKLVESPRERGTVALPELLHTAPRQSW